MTKDFDKGLFQTERQNTDNNLTAERAKATHSLDAANIKSHGQTDEIVKDERSIADLQTASSRAAHDERRDATASSSADPTAAAQLAEERRRSDLATGVERLRMDEALSAERKSTSKLVAKVLENERIATDTSLVAERKTTDDECEGTSNLLKTEVAQHKMTQVTLTSREELLAIVSHDLKNPVGAISGYANLMLEGEGTESLTADNRKFANAIKRNAEVSLRLISDLLDLERISQNKLVMDFTQRDAKDIVNTAVDSFMPLAVSRKVKLVANLPQGKLELECDFDRILQVVSNLIGNALKFTPDGGVIQVSANAQDAVTEFCVTDSGCGIPKEKQTEIFKRFAQLKSNERTGLGLGLYIAKTIVGFHSGNLTVNSQIGKGSTFSFKIPKNVSAQVH